MAIVRVSNVKFKHWDALKEAVKQMVERGDYQKLVAIHAVRDPNNPMAGRHRMHSHGGIVGKLRFLPWHRAYLIKFERALRAIDDRLSIPYWDWDNDEGQLIGFQENFAWPNEPRELGHLPDGTPQSDNNELWFSSHQATAALETFDGSYNKFTGKLEAEQHNAGHDWIGGDMSNIQFSPRDIAFWLHHAAVDRVWAKWQTQNQGKRAGLTGRDARLDPWGNEFDIVNIDNIANLGGDSYSY